MVILMTVREARLAMKYRVPVQTCGATAVKMYCKTRYQRIQRLSLNYDKYGMPFWTVDLIGEFNTKTGEYTNSHVLVCGPEDIELPDDSPEILRSKVYPLTEEGANDGSNLV